MCIFQMRFLLLGCRLRQSLLITDLDSPFERTSGGQLRLKGGGGNMAIGHEADYS